MLENICACTQSDLANCWLARSTLPPGSPRRSFPLFVKQHKTPEEELVSHRRFRVRLPWTNSLTLTIRRIRKYLFSDQGLEGRGGGAPDDIEELSEVTKFRVKPLGVLRWE